jgi:hypothetical protein
MASASGQPGRNVITTTTFELIGVGALAILAGMNDDLGGVIVILMWGFLIGWLFLHSASLASWIPKAG